MIPADYRAALRDRLDMERFGALAGFVADERAEYPVFPPEARTFAALELTPFDRVRVVILGQDPYHDFGQAHGLAFSVPEDQRRLPPSLKNIFRELGDDLGVPQPARGDLTAWGEQGVLLLNSVMTVRAHEAASHSRRGWEEFTDCIISALNDREKPLVFVLWGAYAQSKRDLINQARHRILESAHPSPLSAHRGFLGSRVFSRVNRTLEELGHSGIEWSLAERDSGDFLPFGKDF